MKLLNVFKNPAEQLDLRKLHPVPLVGVPDWMHGFPSADRVHVYLQRADLWPVVHSLKLPPAFQMLIGAKERGQLDGVHTLTDSGSGNAAIAEATLAYFFGMRIVIFAPSDIAESKAKRLRKMGNVELLLCYGREGELTPPEQARLRGEEKGCFYLGQYDNPDNCKGHYLYHLLPAWSQLRGTMSVYAGGLGTCGHIGAALEFRKTVHPIAVVAAHCEKEHPLPGIRPLERLRFRFAQECLADPNLYKVAVRQPEAYQSSLELTEERNDAGPTCGAAWTALIKFLTFTKENNPEGWEGIRNEGGDRICVVMDGDPRSAYGDERYQHVLEPHQIPSGSRTVYRGSDYPI